MFRRPDRPPSYGKRHPTTRVAITILTLGTLALAVMLVIAYLGLRP